MFVWTDGSSVLGLVWVERGRLVLLDGLLLGVQLYLLLEAVLYKEFPMFVFQVPLQAPFGSVGLSAIGNRANEFSRYLTGLSPLFFVRLFVLRRVVHQ